MPYPVPQFIKEETKLMGLINFIQLSILVGFFGLFGLLWVTLQKWLAVTLILIFSPFVAAIVFGKIHDVPIYKLVGSMFRYFWLPKQYTFKKEILYQGLRHSKTPQSKVSIQPSSQKKQLDRQTLQNLSDILDK